MERTILERVRVALQYAAENGYDMFSYVDGEIAQDLLSYDANLGSAPIIEILKAIKEVRKEASNGKTI